MNEETPDREAIREAWERAKAREADEAKEKKLPLSQTIELQNSLIPCPACNNPCSPSALTCPSCGHPLDKDKKNNVGNYIDKLSLHIRNQYNNSRKRMFLIVFAGLFAVSSVIYGIYRILSIDNFERERFRRELHRAIDMEVDKLCEAYFITRTKCEEIRKEHHKNIDDDLDGKKEEEKNK